MRINAYNLEEYLNALPADRREVVKKLRDTIVEHLPEGFEETVNAYGIAYVVPFSLYPAGYHCPPKQPLPFLTIASQKNFVAVYHMGIYADEQLSHWFTGEYPKYVTTKLDMGKSCIRFKNMAQLPFALIGELATKMTPQAWIALYEQNLAAR